MLSKSIPLIRGDTRSDARIEVDYRPVGGVRLVLRSDALHAEEEADDAFSALQNLRRQLQREGADLLCYGSSRHVFPSAMSRTGTKAYKTFLGQQGRSSDLVDIFDQGPDIELVSVEAQEAFHREWFESLGKR